jgi:hypothetical protein
MARHLTGRVLVAVATWVAAAAGVQAAPEDSALLAGQRLSLRSGWLLKSYGRILNDWVRDNVKSLIERHQRWLNSPPPVVTDVIALVAATEPSTAPPITALQSGANRTRS